MKEQNLLPNLDKRGRFFMKRIVPLKIAVIYAIVGSLWIFFSNSAVEKIALNDAATYTRLQTAKGWFYIAVTASMLYFLVKIDRDKLLRSQEHLYILNQELEQRVERRTKTLQQTNQELKESLDTLQQTQTRLAQSEKMAAPGELVAGVAHEINTPIGVSLTAASFLDDQTKTFYQRYESKNIRRSELEHYLSTAFLSSSTILRNLKRAAELINSFKQVAVDQSSEKQRIFHLKKYIDEILLSLSPHYKKTNLSIIVNCSETLKLYSYPGAFAQILTNLIMNSLLHGFEGISKGEILIDVSTKGHQLLLRYSDNGVGMEETHVQEIFNPFFYDKTWSWRKWIRNVHCL
jgi:signal transduction histidine kinase